MGGFKSRPVEGSAQTCLQSLLKLLHTLCFQPLLYFALLFYFFEKGGQEFRKFMNLSPGHLLSLHCHLIVQSIATELNFNHMCISSLDQLQHSPATSTVKLSCSGVKNKSSVWVKIKWRKETRLFIYFRLFFCRFLSTQQGKVISVLKRTNDSEVCFCLSAFAHSTRWRLLTLESLGAHTLKKPSLLLLQKLKWQKIFICKC